jgi:cobalt-zinc-cadmium efflux system outer membrane protein
MATNRNRQLLVAAVMAWLGLCAAPPPIFAQLDSSGSQRTAILEFPNLGPIPGSTEPTFGPGPGALTPSMSLGGAAGGTSPGLLGGKRRTGRLPRGGRANPAASSLAATRGLGLPEALPAPPPAATAPGLAAPIDIALLDDAGPPDGLTLDAAIDRTMQANFDIRALRQELAQADADILTAGLRTNPLIYMDTQFIPYGAFSNERPGGPTQYDLNITYPLDVSRKRQARVVVARMARTTLEAQFQDVSRRQIANVGKAFVNLQAARIDSLSMAAAVRRQEQFLAEFRRTADPADARAADAIDHLSFVLERARTTLGDALEAYDDAREGLGVLLSLPAEDTARLEPSGRLRSDFPPPPSGEDLSTLALRCRPDLRAARLGLDRAGAEIALQRANRFDDVFLFYDPITIQDASPYGRQSASSWAVGLTFSLPVFNRNQGNIARAESNMTQTRLELASLERRIAAEVRLAEREYRRSREALEQIEREVVPRATALVERKTAEFAAGRIGADDFQDNLDTVAEVTQSHRDALLRHRRAMLELNTAVGLRLLP